MVLINGDVRGDIILFNICQARVSALAAHEQCHLEEEEEEEGEGEED